MLTPSGGSIADRTYLKLEELIVLTDLKPRVVYTESELCKLVDCGRTPLREALQRLVVEGLVEVQHRGVMITDVDTDQQFKLLEVRRPIQKFSVKCVVANATKEDLKKMSMIIEKLEANRGVVPKNRAEILTLIRNAHDIFLCASHNEFIIKVMNTLRGVSRRFWMYYLKPEDVAPAIELYIQLLKGVVGQDMVKSLVASEAIIDYLEGYAKKTIKWR